MSKKELLWYFLQGAIFSAGVLFFVQLVIPLPTTLIGIIIPVSFGIIRMFGRIDEMERYRHGVPGKYKIHGSDVYIRSSRYSE